MLFEMFNFDDEFRMNYTPFETLIVIAVTAGCKILRMPVPSHTDLGKLTGDCAYEFA